MGFVDRALLRVAVVITVAQDLVRAEEDDEVEENDERRLKLNIIIVTVTILIGISLLFEVGKERLLEMTSDNMLPIMNSLFGELTLLGFIGLSLYLLFRMSWVSELSKKVYGDAERIDELGESVHMVLFLVMVLFLAQAVAMARWGENSQRLLSEWEAHQCNLVSRRTAKAARSFLDASYIQLVVQPHLPRRLKALIFAATREKFMKAYDLDEHAFDFANYVAIALGRTLAELVEVPVRTWLGLEVCLLMFYVVDSVLTVHLRFALWIVLGYGVLGSAFVAHGKIRSVLRNHVGGKIQATLAHVDGVPHDDVDENPESFSRAPPPPPAESPRKVPPSVARGKTKAPPYAKQGQRRPSLKIKTPLILPPTVHEHDVVSDQPGLRSPPPRSQGNSDDIVDDPILVDDDDDDDDYLDDEKIDDLDEVASPKDVPTCLPRLDSFRAVSKRIVRKVEALWGDTGSSGYEVIHAGHGHSDDTRCIGLLNRGFAIVGACLETVVRWGERACCDDGMQRWCEATSRCCAEKFVYFMPPASMSPTHASMSKDENDEYIEQFWMGSSYKAHFTLAVIRTIPLFMSIYIAVVVLQYAEHLFGDHGTPSRTLGDAVRHYVAEVVLVGLAFAPPVLLQLKLPVVVQDFAIIANVDSLLNLRFVEQVITHQRTVAAFQALRIVAILRHPELLSRILAEEEDAHHHPAAPVNIVEDLETQDDDDPQHQGPRRRNSWAKAAEQRDAIAVQRIYEKLDSSAESYHDEDGTLVVDHDIHPEVEDDIVEKLQAEDAIESRRRRSWANIFQLFDDDHEGTIDTTEMHQLLKKFSTVTDGQPPEVPPADANPPDEEDERDHKDDEIRKVIELLDKDKSGEISFDEFYEFGKALEHHIGHLSDGDNLVEDMFRMIDKDGGGLITVEELHETIRDIGFELSVNVVYNMIRDIDVDGNGALDLKEFHLLVDRVDADFHAELGI